MLSKYVVETIDQKPTEQEQVILDWFDRIVEEAELITGLFSVEYANNPIDVLNTVFMKTGMKYRVIDLEFISKFDYAGEVELNELRKAAEEAEDDE